MGHAIEIERRGAVGLVILNRPERLNTIGPAVLTELNAVVDEASHPGTFRALVITGSGRAFSAGGDIEGFDPDLSADAFAASALEMTDLLDRIESLPIPVIAAINGLALGGGLELALACDLRFAASGAKLGVPEIALGFLPGGGGTARLTKMLPPAMAKQMLMSGRPITAAEAHRIGLVNELTDDPASCVARALEFAGHLASMPPLAIAAAKRLVNDGALLPLADAIVLERRTVTGLFDTHDRREGVAAFFDKRRPAFHGR